VNQHQPHLRWMDVGCHTTEAPGCVQSRVGVVNQGRWMVQMQKSLPAVCCLIHSNTHALSASYDQLQHTSCTCQFGAVKSTGTTSPLKCTCSCMRHTPSAVLPEAHWT
jgi:hypothetical protein